MRKIIFIFICFIFTFGFVKADSDYVNDYTLIDCVNGDNDTGVAFDKTKPYATLKEGIEKSIDYINKNVNYRGNELTASGKIFTIKVNCSFYDILNPSINLNFLGANFNNELIIEGVGNNSLVFKNIDFKLSNNTGNITFKNAIFLNDNKPYFYDDFFEADKKNLNTPFSNGIKIIDSYIKLSTGNNLGNLGVYKILKYINKNGMIDYFYYSNYTNHQMIEKSIIDIYIDKDYTFRLPVLLKDSKINFINTGSIVHNISILEDGNPNINNYLNYSVLVSNKFDFGGNNLNIENTQNIAFLNNKLSNYSNIYLGGNTIFVNNYFDSIDILDISGYYYLFNNLFGGPLLDNYDKLNYRKNYSINNAGTKGFGWVYKRIRSNKYFNIDINSSSLYKEITGQEKPFGLGEIYLIFNY